MYCTLLCSAVDQTTVATRIPWLFQWLALHAHRDLQELCCCPPMPVCTAALQLRRPAVALLSLQRQRQRRWLSVAPRLSLAPVLARVSLFVVLGQRQGLRGCLMIWTETQGFPPVCWLMMRATRVTPWKKGVSIVSVAFTLTLFNIVIMTTAMGSLLSVGHVSRVVRWFAMDGSGTLPVTTGTNWPTKRLVDASMHPFAMAKGEG